MFDIVVFIVKIKLLSLFIGSPSIHSYHNATYVHFNPPFPEVIHQRTAALDHLERPSAADFLPVV